MATEKKNSWRPKKYEDVVPTHFSSNIPPYFRDTWKNFLKLHEADKDNVDFLNFLQTVEEDEKPNVMTGKISKRLRWLITKYVIDNFNKLN